MFEILPDLVISAETDPVRKGAVLLHLLAEDALSLEGLVRRLKLRVNENEMRRKYDKREREIREREE